MGIMWRTDLYQMKMNVFRTSAAYTTFNQWVFSVLAVKGLITVCFHTGSSKPVACTSSHEGRKIIQVVVPVHVDLLFTMLFTNSKFYLDFHSVRRTSGEWWEAEYPHNFFHMLPISGVPQADILYMLCCNQLEFQYSMMYFWEVCDPP